jgi:hypothetical protein
VACAVLSPLLLTISTQADIAHPASRPPAKADATRIPGNVLFNKTGVLVASASAMPVDHFAARMKMAGVTWIALQIDNGGVKREDNIADVERGWADQWRAAGFKVGFWGCPRGIATHGSQASYDAAVPIVQTDAKLGATLTAKLHGEFYIADCEDSYQGYDPKDPAPGLNRIYVEAFTRAAKELNIANIPRALSSEGRVALEMKPWIDAGWDAMPQAYWNSYAVYQPSLCVDFYVKTTGWPIERVHPTIATFTGEGENRTVTLDQYAADLKSRGTVGFSYYLPESYLKTDDVACRKLGDMGKR